MRKTLLSLPIQRGFFINALGPILPLSLEILFHWLSLVNPQTPVISSFLSAYKNPHFSYLKINQNKISFLNLMHYFNYHLTSLLLTSHSWKEVYPFIHSSPWSSLALGLTNLEALLLKSNSDLLSVKPNLQFFALVWFNLAAVF